MLFDAHTHLNFEKYTEEERRGLAAEIEASDVGCIIDVADCVEAAKLALKDADDYPWCYAAVGIHPDHARDYEGICGDDPEKRRSADARLEADLEEIRKLAAHPKAVAIGEIGLAGECRAIPAIEQRINEAARIGFTQIMVPYRNTINKKIKVEGAEIIPVKSIFDALKIIK